MTEQIQEPEPTKMPIAPHNNKLVSAVIVRFPDFIYWLAERTPIAEFDWLYEHIQEQVDIFDGRPFTQVTCAGRVDGQPCTLAVKRYSLYQKSAMPSFWCATCDPLQLGANEDKLATYTGYYDGIRYVHRFGANRLRKRALVRRLANAKGLTGNFTERKVMEFFRTDPVE